MPAKCQARCLVWSPRASMSGNFGIANCEQNIGHADPHRSKSTTEYNLQHEVVNVLPTAIVWYHDDRRTFFGNVEECPDDRCVLPAQHGRKHAY